MRELKIFSVVVFFSLVTYYLVEPYAHHEMHKKVDANGDEIHVSFNNFKYDGSADIEEALRAGDKEKAESKKAFWAEVGSISTLEGDVVRGEEIFANCIGCHTPESPRRALMGGVSAPSLEHAGAIYDKDYLIAVIKDPAIASNIDHKFEDTTMHPMGSIKYMISEDQRIADVVAYIMQEKASEVTPDKAFEDACLRCHAVRYKKSTILGEVPKFKSQKEELAYKIDVIDATEELKGYMGSTPPDLSMIIRARSADYLKTFIENPQSQLAGTAMPRVGLSQQGYDKIEEYLIESGDPSRAKREALGPIVIGFFVIFTLLAFLWKKYQWRDLH